MKKIIFSLVTILFFQIGLFAAVPTMLNTDSRIKTLLNGEWKIIIDPFENGYYDYRYLPFDRVELEGQRHNGYFLDLKARDASDLLEYNFDAAESLKVPGDWNSQKERLFYYEGTIWYRKKFNYKKSHPQNRVFVHFGAANYKAEVYFNGKKLGTHEGGFTPFSFEITELLNPENNSLVVKVDNKRERNSVPTLNFDWWNYGGLTREVSVIEVPAVFVNDYHIQLKNNNRNIIQGYVRLNGNSSAKEVTVSIPELKTERTIIAEAGQKAFFEIPVQNVSLWEPQSPKLYQVMVSTSEETLKEKIGFRTISTQQNKILLNGQPVFLRGICIHEESPLTGGRAHSEADARLLLGWAKELGCNFVRLAHYPHNENMLKIADEMGMLVWSEIPVYWTIDWNSQETLENAEKQLFEMIARDRNRASIIIWAVANETPVSAGRNNFLRSLIHSVKAMDSTRLISAALEKKQLQPDVYSIDDPIMDDVDVISFNQYIGWYGSHPEECRKAEWQLSKEKPFIMSEFGGGALAGFHTSEETRWSEEFQEKLYIESIEMIKKIEGLSGISPWVLMDFKSPRRLLNGIQDNYNRKGLISETGQRKKAYFVLKDFYEQKMNEPIQLQ